MIDFHNVTVSFFGDKKALNNISFKIKRGEFVYITGKSGAGKSTLLRLIYADLKPTSGVVLIAKKNLNYITESSIPYLRRNIGVIFQDFKLLEDYTVYENILIALEIFYLEKKDMENKIIPLLHKLDIYSKRNTLVKKLSGGEKQRVAIARALINEPIIVLADEPTGNLDPERAENTIKLLQDIARNGSTVIVATHDKHLIEKFPARTITLENGKIISDIEII
ncbi:cell division ATP-binding protein FtsE [Deferribacter desulfuricans SSM1]|uniref:Cell division ATP-binding protein FtsE n=1 Tax=Deferribacter desulfuricans (strain DSM 14783 / JCM 11476 / NBRC 101012 / SSM1) TaxID=639282 RepID=D3PE00_DEFDS|nr:cell division ATP-binding protein FtsE [Deferribacter desulfuricans]BAI80823.1 cell division ATP-binding protein FtsE [Deferribacter desulfuricans SSM1]